MNRGKTIIALLIILMFIVSCSKKHEMDCQVCLLNSKPRSYTFKFSEVTICTMEIGPRKVEIRFDVEDGECFNPWLTQGEVDRLKATKVTPYDNKIEQR